jgi:hypothetical protein
VSYPLLNLFLTMLWFFLWILWFILLFRVIVDIFRDDDLGGWGKAGWMIFVCVLPFLGIFVYLIAQGKSMGERAQHRAEAQKAQMDDYVRSVASSSSPTDEIARGKELFDQGAITQAEYDQLKARALAT